MMNLAIIPGLIFLNALLTVWLAKKQTLLLVVSQILFIALIILTAIAEINISTDTKASIDILSYQNITLTLSLGFDALTQIMLLFILVIGFVIYRYAINYLSSDTTRMRFLTQFNLLLFSAVLLVMANNLLTAFVAWQFIGISLYLLLNHYHFDQAANKAAKKKFVINRLGDCTFLLAIVIAYHTEQSTLFQQLQQNEYSWLFCSLIFISAMTKCAQFPFHIWLLDTMETPTPVSAIMHAGIINAGGILLTRISSVINTEHFLMYSIFFTGLITLMLSSNWMSTQLDTKKKLAYSTMGQMGYMMTQCGLGMFPAAIFHLISHGFFKASLFLNSGATLDNRQQQGVTSSYLKVMLTLLITTICFLPLIYLTKQLEFTLPIFVYGFIFLALSSFVHKLILDGGLKYSFIALLFALLILAIYIISLAYFSNSLSNYEITPKINVWLQLAVILLLLYIQIGRWLSIRLGTQFFPQDRIEFFFRKNMLNPLRAAGDKLNFVFFCKKQFTLFCVALFILGLANYFYFSSSESHTARLFLTLCFLLATIVILIAANRSKRLFQLLILMSLFEVAFVSIALISVNIKIVNLGLFHLVNVAPVLWMLFVLVKSQTVDNPRPLNVNNVLPARLVYLFLGMLMLIGIPGTGSFISEFYLLSHLLSLGIITIILYLVLIILLSIVIMHALQLYVFNKNYSQVLTQPLNKIYHIIFSGVLILNIIFGLHPSLLLDMLNH